MTPESLGCCPSRTHCSRMWHGKCPLASLAVENGGTWYSRLLTIWRRCDEARRLGGRR